MPSDPGLQEAVWLLLEITASQQRGQAIHSDFVIRKFPKVNEQDLINAIGGLAKDGKVTLKAASVDAHGNATAYHIRVRGYEDRPAEAPPTRAQTSVGFGDTTVASSTPQSELKPGPRKVGLTIQNGKIGVSADTGGVKEQPRPPEPGEVEPDRVLMGTGRIAVDNSQQNAEEQFADEVASFFAELAAAASTYEEEKKQLIDQMAVLMAMFQSADSESFTTPMAKLATLKEKVRLVAPELVPDYVVLVQSAVRAWLGRV